jgi:tRNA-2-methylthio-N6-dimethylallyladenosine synthase
MNLIQRIGFDHSFSFVYSARPGTPAADLPDETPEATKKQRLKILQERITQQASQISRRMVGTTQIILVTGASERNPEDLCGRTENNRNTFFTCDDHSLIGKFVQVRITEAYANSLRGEVINADLAY